MIVCLRRSPARKAESGLVHQICRVARQVQSAVIDLYQENSQSNTERIADQPSVTMKRLIWQEAFTCSFTSRKPGSQGRKRSCSRDPRGCTPSSERCHRPVPSDSKNSTRGVADQPNVTMKRIVWKEAFTCSFTFAEARIARQKAILFTKSARLYNKFRALSSTCPIT